MTTPAWYLALAEAWLSYQLGLGVVAVAAELFIAHRRRGSR